MTDLPQSQHYDFDLLVSENDLTQSWISTNLRSGERCFLKVPSKSGVLDPITIREILSKSFACQRNIRSGRVHSALSRRLERGSTIIEYPYIDTSRWVTLTPKNFWPNFEHIFPQVCLIVDFIHLLGYIHCDLKMENFVADFEKEPVRLLMIDLDFLITENSPVKAKIIGTPKMIAPEVIANETFTAKSDNYSIGKSMAMFVAEAERLDSGQYLESHGLREKLDSLIGELTLGDSLKRPSFLLDALRHNNIISEERFNSLNRTLFSMQLLSNFRNELEYRIPPLAQLQKFLTERAKIFGVPDEFLTDLESAYRKDRRYVFGFIRPFIKKANLRRYEDCWHLRFGDRDLESAFSVLESTADSYRESVFTNAIETKLELQKAIKIAEEYKKSRQFLKAYLLNEAILKAISSNSQLAQTETTGRLFSELAKLAVTMNRKSEAINYLSEGISFYEDHPEQHLRLLIDIIYQYLSIDELDKAWQAINLGIQKADLIKNGRYNLEFLRYKAWILSARGNHEESLELLEDLEQQAKSRGDSHILLTTYNYMGSLFWRKSKFERAQRYFGKCLDIARREPVSRESISCFVNMAMICFELSEYKKAIRYSKLALQQMGKDTEVYGTSHIYNLMIVCYTRIGEYNKARHWNQRLLSAGLSDYTDSDFSRYYFNDGFMNVVSGDFVKAWQSLNKSMNILLTSEPSRYLGKVYSNLAELALYNGNAEDCARYLRDACQVFHKLGDTSSIIECELFGALNDIYNNHTETSKALVPILKKLIKAHSLYIAAVGLFHILVEGDPELSRSAIMASKSILPVIEGAETPLYKALQGLLNLHNQPESDISHRFSTIKSAFRILNEAGHYFHALLICRKIAALYIDQSKHKLAGKFLSQAWKHAERIKNQNMISTLDAQLKGITESGRTKTQSVEFLHDISEILRDISDYDKTLRRLIQFAVNETGAERGALLLKSDKNSELQVKSYINCDDESLKDIKDISRSVPQYAEKIGKPLIIDNALDDKRTRGLKSIIMHNIHSVICLPVYRDKDILGVLYLDHHTIPALFDEDDITIISSMANLISHILTTAIEYKSILYSRNQLLTDLTKMGGHQPFVTQNETMLKLLERFPEIANTNASILLLGESGTGKEILCEIIHSLSPRKNGPLVKLNCTTFPEGLIESELFGIGKDVATGVREKMGKLEAADGGTLFLDEVGDMPPLMQSKVLRVLEYQQFSRVGSNRTISTDVRFIYASNKDIYDLLQEDKFRNDLYFRISTITIEIPPLRERPDDIPLLCEHFIKIFSEGKKRPEFSPGVRNLLLKYNWPGNVRELKNLVERTCILHAGQTVEINDLPPNMIDYFKKSGKDLGVAEAAEKDALIKALAKSGGNKSKASNQVKMPYTTFLRKMKRYGITDEDYAI